MIKSKITELVSKLAELEGIIQSVILLGSQSAKKSDSDSDIDILILTRLDITPESAEAIGNNISEVFDHIDVSSSFCFYNPICEKCRLTSSQKWRYHVITHTWENIQKWLYMKKFIVCMWSLKSTVLWGDDPFREKYQPDLNDSLLDDLDGIPGYIREINNVLITKSPRIDSHEYKRHCKYYLDRIREIRRYFPEIASAHAPPENPTDRSGLIQISNYFALLKYEIQRYLSET